MKNLLFFTSLVGSFLFFGIPAYAATLSLSPSTGVYSLGGTFTVNIVINTQGKPINAADAQLSFNPRELAVVSATRATSIFNLWTQEPSYSNTAGTINLGGGSPTGYTGSSGKVATVTFRSLLAGTPKVEFKSGSVLAADGMGTNVLSTMSGGTFTINAAQTNPEPEYIAPANTPSAPKVTSTTHPDPEKWYREKTAVLTWSLPSGITSVRTLLDQSPNTIPTIVYDEPLTKRTIDDLPEGVSYFHVQLKNADGWGKVTHYRLAVDTESPEEFTVSEAEGQDSQNPTRTLKFSYRDASPVTRFTISIDGAEPIEHEDVKETKQYALPTLTPGHHSILVEAFDSAGNSRTASYSFDIATFERPSFTEYPTRVGENVIPALRGTTRPNARVEVTVTGATGGESKYTLDANENGSFTFIPDSPFSIGVYDIIAVATDAYGAVSEPSEAIRIIVEKPGYLRFGSFVVSVLSVLIPLIALIFIMVIGCWYLWYRFVVWKRKVQKETLEAEDRLRIEFTELVQNLNAKVEELKDSRKSKLTKAETALIDAMVGDLKTAQSKIRKEISDIEDIVQ